MKHFVLLLFLFSACTPRDEWSVLFNGKDLNGWDTWLAEPHRSYDVPGMARDSTGNYREVIGLNNDPLGVFTVKDINGVPAIRISGQGWGALTTREDYSDFHLSLEYKWGSERWAPRDSAKRDSGILYFCVGEHGAGSGAWMQSQECQVQEGDTGDYWSVGGAIADVRAGSTTVDGLTYLKYDPASEIKTIGKDFDGRNWSVLRCIKRETNENPGEWNRVDIYAVGGTSVHVVNGATVMVLQNSRRILNGTEIPLTSGKIQLQSEGAEVFYRDIKIRPLKNLPAGALD
jgi:hypothetical protein